MRNFYKRYILTLKITECAFSLVELLLVMAISAIFLSITIPNVISYKNYQSIQESTRDIVTMLQTAKSDAQSQVKPTICSGQLVNYTVKISPPVTFELDANCDTPVHLQISSLPNGITFTSVSSSLTFPVFSSVITIVGSNKIILQGFGSSKTINIDSNGNPTAN